MLSLNKYSNLAFSTWFDLLVLKVTDACLKLSLCLLESCLYPSASAEVS